MFYRLHVFPDLLVLVGSIFVQLHLSYWVWTLPGWQSMPRRAALIAGNLLSAALLLVSYLLSFLRPWLFISTVLGQWSGAVGLVLCTGLIGLYLGILVWRASARYEPPGWANGAHPAARGAAGVARGLSVCVGEDRRGRRCADPGAPRTGHWRQHRSVRRISPRQRRRRDRGW